MSTVNKITLPNGSLLERGGRVRILRTQLDDIPMEVWDIPGIHLELDTASPDSEVIAWSLIANE
jgi:hypothetical protein